MPSLIEEAEMLLGLKFVFSGMNFPIEQAKAIIFGVPLDVTSTGKRGSNFGPNAIREASAVFLGTFSSSKKKNFFEKTKTQDLGDLLVTPGSLKETMERITKMNELILKNKKIPILLGGEHTISFGSLKAFKEKPLLVVFDSHADLLEEFNGDKLMHGSVMKRILEFIPKQNVLFVGLQAMEKEEFDFIEKNKIQALYLEEIKKDFEKAKQKIAEFTKGKSFYLSFDIDALHPHIVPATGTVQPDGLQFSEAIELLSSIKGKICGMDLVECIPDSEKITQTTSAKLLVELLSMDFW